MLTLFLVYVAACVCAVIGTVAYEQAVKHTLADLREDDYAREGEMPR